MPPSPIRSGKQQSLPPSDSSAAPAEPAAQPEPASPEFKAPEPAAESPALQSGAFDLADAANALRHVAGAALSEPAPLRAVPSYVATLPIFVGGERGTIQVGEAFAPTDDAERILLLSQNAIREA